MKKDHLRIASVNVNGLRAAYKADDAEWAETRVRQLLGDGWHILHAEAEAKGRAGVAIASREEPLATRNGIGDDYFATAGRWVEGIARDRTVRDGFGLPALEKLVVGPALEQVAKHPQGATMADDEHALLGAWDLRCFAESE